MNDIDLNNIKNLSLKYFDLIKKEYEIYLNKESKDFINNIDIQKLYKIINDHKLPNIFYLGNTYYLNTFYNLKNIEKLIPFLCFSSLTQNINPLKIGLIELEIKNLNDKYNLDIETNFKEELEIAEIFSKGLLNDIPDKILFKNSDLEIINYLNNEYGNKIGMLYYNISYGMKKIRDEKDYYNVEKKVDYSNIIDYLYGFISNKVR